MPPGPQRPQINFAKVNLGAEGMTGATAAQRATGDALRSGVGVHADTMIPNTVQGGRTDVSIPLIVGSVGAPVPNWMQPERYKGRRGAVRGLGTKALDATVGNAGMPLIASGPTKWAAQGFLPNRPAIPASGNKPGKPERDLSGKERAARIALAIPALGATVVGSVARLLGRGREA